MGELSSDAERRPGAGPSPGMPRWVKLLGIVVLVLAVLLVVLHLTGDSLGGPGSHLGSADPALLWP